MAACQVLTSRGTEVFATAGSVQKRTMLRGLGINVVPSSRSTRFVEDLLLMSTSPVDIILNCLTSTGMVAASCAVLHENGHFAEISKRDIWSYEASNSEQSGGEFRLVAFDMIPIKRLYSMLLHLSRQLQGSCIVPVISKQSGLQALRECMREMSAGLHVGKTVISLPFISIHQGHKGALTITGGLVASEMQWLRGLLKRVSRGYLYCPDLVEEISILASFRFHCHLHHSLEVTCPVLKMQV